MNRTNREVVETFWRDVWTEGRSELLAELFASDATENGEPLDIGAFQRAVDRWREKFQPFEARIEEILEIAPDRIASRVTYIGAQVQPWLGLPGDGKTFAVPGIDLFRLKDGRIVELWHATDHLELVQQLGGKVVPMDGT